MFTYNVKWYGNVDTTISGSGNLTPVSQQTMAVEQPVTATAVNYAAGDNVEEGTVIATAEDAQGGSIDYTAPYDCVLLELPVSSGDELEAGGEVAMVMGTEGFTMGIAVDEQDISAVAVGQEVAFTVDAVDGEYIRLWRSLHNHLFVRRQRFQWCGWQRLIPVCAGSIVIVSRPGPSQIVQRHAEFGLKMDRVSDVEAV